MEKIAKEQPSAQRQIIVGRITVRLLGSENIEIIRHGAPGAGKSGYQRMWNRDQIEAAWISARQRRGIDAREQEKALRWALEAIANG